MSPKIWWIKKMFLLLQPETSSADVAQLARAADL